MAELNNIALRGLPQAKQHSDVVRLEILPFHHNGSAL
jgi:hypothetical protein